MYEPYRGGEVRMTLEFTWDPDTAKGFAVAMLVVLILMISLAWIDAPEWKPPIIDKLENSIPIDLMNIETLSFGEGDGTGGSKGNLSREGAMHRGAVPADQLENAHIKAPSGSEEKTIADNTELSQNMKPADNLSSGDKSDGSTGTSNQNTGSPEGSDNGTGLGEAGDGPGAGTGLGKISWGGGGNRVVVSKPARPKYPANVEIKEAVVTVKFHVDPSGTVIRAVPVSKVDPRLEAVAVAYVKKYRFNPLDSDVIMVGSIRIIFRKS